MHLRRCVASLGAALARIDPFTRRITQALVVRVSLRVLLRLDYPERDETYQLLLFASRDVQSEACLNATAVVQLDRDELVDVLLSCHPKLPERVYFSVFPTAKDEDGLQAQTMLASGSCLVSDFLRPSGLQLTLLDVTREPQGTLQVHVARETQQQLQHYFPPQQHEPLATANLLSRSRASPPLFIVTSERQYSDTGDSRSSATSEDQRYASSVLQRTRQAFERYVNAREGEYVSVDTQAGTLPVIAFVVLAAQIRVEPRSAERWLLYLLGITCGRLGVDASTLTRDHGCDNAVEGELISEMALWQVRSKLYVYDTVRSPDGGRLPCDQWVRMNCFPDQALAGGDCEDFSVTLLEFCHVFAGLQLHSPALRHLQSVLLAYLPCLVIGQLATQGKAPSSHAYVALLDANWVKTRVRGATFTPAQRKRLRPALVLEGTCYTESTWRSTQQDLSVDLTATPEQQRQMSVRRDRAAYAAQNQLLDTREAALYGQKYERAVKYRMPADVVHSERKYGKMFALLTADYCVSSKSTSLDCVHWLLSSEQSERLDVPRLGVPHADVAFYEDSVHFHAAVQLDAREARKMDGVLRDLPFSTFQRAPLPQERGGDEFNHSPTRSRDCLLFDMRWCDWLAMESSVRRAVEQLIEQLQPELWSVEYQRLDISADIPTMVIALRRQQQA